MRKSSMLQNTFVLVLLSLLSALLAACSGGGGDSLAGGGIGGTGMTVSSVGTATGLGSVIVNGVTYDTAAAEVFVDGTSMGIGNQALVQNIAVGMVVRVEGRLAAEGNSIADRIFFRSELKGPVDSIKALDTVSVQAVILGQSVLIDDRTVLKNTQAASITAGMVLEVSGFVDESGSLNATYVRKVSDSLLPEDSVEIKGLVQNLDLQSKTFQFNSLTISYSAASLNGLPGGAPATGQLLRVRGKLGVNGVLVAERIDLEEEFGTGTFDSVDLEGIITQTNPPGEFRIRQYVVTVDSATAYKNLKPADLNRGTRVIVRGALTNKAILADEISLPEDIRIESDVISVDTVENTVVLSGLEQAIAHMTATTRFIGIASELGQIQPSDHARILGRRIPGGDILALTLQTTPSNEAVELAGPAESVSQPVIVILGVQVNTASIPSDRFKGGNGTPVTPEEFFGIVKAGDAVAVEGTQQGGIVSWTSIRLE
jgi:primosomal replication protein N